MKKSMKIKIGVALFCLSLCLLCINDLIIAEDTQNFNYKYPLMVFLLMISCVAFLITLISMLNDNAPRLEDLTPDHYKIDSYTRFLDNGKTYKIFLARREQLKTELVITERAIKEYEAEEKEKEFEMEKDLNEGSPLPE